MNHEFFPARPASRPMIYAYEDANPRYAGLLKVGQTGTYACPAASGNRIFTKDKESLVLWTVE